MEASPAIIVDAAHAQRRSGNLAEAARLYAEALRQAPKNADALYYLALIHCQQGRFPRAIALLRELIAIQPLRASAHNLIGMAFHRLDQLEAALASFDLAISCEPSFAEAHGNRAAVLLDLRRWTEAVESCDQALALAPTSTTDWCIRGAAFAEMRDHEGAIASYDRALACDPRLADAHLGRAYSLARLNRYPEALGANSEALAIDPRRVEALINQGNLLRTLRRFQEALVSYEQALTLHPDHVDALNNRGSVLDDLGRTDEALRSYDKALAIEPNHATVLFNRGNTLLRLQRYDQAIACYERTLAVDPDHPRALGLLAHAYLTICDWTGANAIETRLIQEVMHGRAAISPFALLGFDVGQSAQQKAAQHFTRREFPSVPRAFAHIARPDRQKIRIAYVSADFCLHATMVLAAGLFERHDRDRFEVIGISFGPHDGSPMRRRAEAAFDQFHDVRLQTDDDVCALMLKLGVDIAVDLKGYTEGARPGILARPAPIQVSYLGYPGTMGAEFIDYILADRFVLPPEEEHHYSEKVVYLPDSYQVNDADRESFQRIPSRLEAGLPDTGFVFCCFNNSWKMREAVVRIWMRLLHSVPDSILWLLQTNEFAASNLRRYARMQAIDPERLIFAPKVSVTEHLARLCIADIFLDTLPYNAHTNASDALFVGLPIVTCAGNTFAGRVAGSLLSTHGMHDLIASSLAEYEALALKLASDPAELQSVRRRLRENRFKSPLFDTGRFCQHLEGAYLTMWNAWRRGESPLGFSVERSKSRS